MDENTINQMSNLVIALCGLYTGHLGCCGKNVYVDTSHAGRGSAWAKLKTRGDSFYYLKIEAENHYPASDKHLVFLGDQTAIGHFCALQQLAQPGTSVSGCIVFNDVQTATGLQENCPWLPLQCVVGYESLYDFTTAFVAGNSTEPGNNIFYVVGNARLIVAIRKLLKTYGIEGSSIKSRGFWQ